MRTEEQTQHVQAVTDECVQLTLALTAVCDSFDTGNDARTALAVAVARLVMDGATYAEAVSEVVG